jgi:GMP synthase (glutamine-hydrolysing)
MMFDAPLKAWLSEFLDMVFLNKKAVAAASPRYGASMPATEVAQS